MKTIFINFSIFSRSRKNVGKFPLEAAAVPAMQEPIEEGPRRGGVTQEAAAVGKTDWRQTLAAETELCFNEEARAGDAAAAVTPLLRLLFV